MLKWMWAVAPLFLAAAPSSAEIFKCVGKRGETLYQNFPCESESIALAPQDVSAPAPKKSPVPPAEPGVGMTIDEVKAIWGEPTETVQEEPGNGPRVEVWSYGDSRSVRFDRKGRVSSVQQ